VTLEDLFDDLPIVSVGQFTARVKGLLEGRVPACWVEGEVSNLRRQASGHLYFSLKDRSSQLPSVMFRAQASALSFQLKEGAQVLASGEISVYEPQGRYQLIVRRLQESGEGKLHREFERLKRRLAAEGLFDEQSKRQLPKFPQRVAIVTSPAGAALQDFLQILRRRGWKGRLSVFPSRVQGRGASLEILQGLGQAAALGCFDCIVLARGGGSLEDLWAFNDEQLARGVAGCSVPVVSGVGHEIDFTLCDFAADIRVETPSGAAELISSRCLETTDRLRLSRQSLEHALASGVKGSADRLAALKSRLERHSPAARLEREFLRLDDLRLRLLAGLKDGAYAARARIAGLETRFARVDAAGSLLKVSRRLERLERVLARLGDKRLGELRSRLDRSAAALEALGPEATLRRGFAILEMEDGKALVSVQGAREGAALRARLSDGTLELRVRKSSPGSGSC